MKRSEDGANRHCRGGEIRVLAVGLIEEREAVLDQGLRRLQKLLGRPGLAVEVADLRRHALRAEREKRRPSPIDAELGRMGSTDVCSVPRRGNGTRTCRIDMSTGRETFLRRAGRSARAATVDHA
jgi:hypothetical protein